MKLSTFLLIGLCALTARAQSTNVTALRLTYDLAGVTNNTTINVSAKESAGFLLNYAKDVMVAVQQTNAIPTFQNSIRGTTTSILLKELSRQSEADDFKTNRLDVFTLNLPALISGGVLTSQQLSDLKAMAKSTNVIVVLP